MIIFGSVICVVGLCGLCFGGMYGSAFAGMPQVFAEAQAEFDAELMDPNGELSEEDKEMIETFMAVQEKIMPLIPLFAMTYTIGALVSMGLTIWMGVGTILCLRWSWKILYSIGWLYLGWIVISTVSMLGMLPAYIRMMEAMNEMMTQLAASMPPPSGGSGAPAPTPVPPAMPSSGLMGAMGAFGTIIMMLVYSVPGVLLVVLFGLRDVKLTCELYDRKPRWTDKLPTPLLILWLAFAGGLLYVLCLAPMLPLIQILFPDFNLVLGYLLWALALVYALGMLWLLAKVKPIAWWIAISSVVLSTLVTVAVMANLSPDLYWQILDNVGIGETMRAKFDEELGMDMSAMVDLMFDFATSWLPVVLSSACAIAYLIWVKRFFPSKAPADAADNPPAQA